MGGPWRADARFADGRVKTCAELFDYLRPVPAEDAREPPRKKRKTNEENVTERKGYEVDEADAILLSSEDFLLQFPSSAHTLVPTGESLDVIVRHVYSEDDGKVSFTIYPCVPNQSLRSIHDPVGLKLNGPFILPLLQDIASLPNVVQNKLSVAWARCSLTSQVNGIGQCLLQTQIFWAPERSLLDGRSYKEQRELDALLYKYLPPDQPRDVSRWSPQDFYENVHVPAVDTEIPRCLESTALDCKLYPFQQRAVKWLMHREGAIAEDNVLVNMSYSESSEQELPASFTVAKDKRGSLSFVSYVHGVVIKNKESLAGYRPVLSGGVLAEEMGLGKTVEIIALSTLHKQPVHLKGVVMDGVTQSPSTLIITPSHILQQWINEIATHAPHLKVLHYKGLSEKDYTVQALMKYDIVLTTYNVLSREIHYAETPPDRSLRRAPKYKPRRCPLVLTKWWRVCLDEAQMIESGVSAAAKVARLIPRVNAWAVSGTPLKKDVADLHGLLIFLGYEPFASSKVAWNRLDRASLRRIFGSIALRHNKHKVSHELRLPPQRRVVITMPFTQIEEQNYDQLYRQMCGVLGLNGDGSPALNEFDPNSPRVVEYMRTWLRRLRETCLHPQVGSQNRRALGRSSKELRTVNEVLETMIEQNETELRAQERSLILAQVVRAHIVNNDKSSLYRSRDALKIYQNALEKVTAIVEESRKEYAVEKAAATKNPSAAANMSSDEESDSENDDGKEGSEKNKRLSTMKKRLRSALEAQHVCMFFVATSYFQMKESKELERTADEITRLEELETQHYDKAKAVRRELLQPTHKAATKPMKTLSKKRAADANHAPIIPEIPTVQTRGGIETQKLVEKVDLVSDVMDEIAKLITEWKDKIINALLRPLVDEDEGQETTGEEYEDSTKLQDELYVYITALRAFIADYQRCISGEANLLMEVEMKGYIKEAKKGNGHAPELLLKIADIRARLVRKVETSSLRGTIAEARSIATDLRHGPRGLAEGALIEELIKEIQPIASAQSKAVETLEKEQNLYRSCMNERLEYYRQLQQLSDMVAPWKEELDNHLDHRALEANSIEEQNHTARLATLKTTKRFYEHLRAEANGQVQGRICVICTDKFENGVLTVCGHQYCKDCITAWLRHHRTCPECRFALGPNDFHDITYKTQQIRAQEEQNDKSASASPLSRDDNTTSSRSAGTSIYSDMSATTMEEIKAIDLNGSFGTKIDTICRHLIWLRDNDPGAKSIIFSQYGDFLSVLSSALKHFKISCVSIHDKNGIEKFRRDPSKECFLLDAKSDSSGLNLVNATHVFLCEPLINAAIELQAIARVHRIGQLRETTVYMYLINDTVEEAIYEISVARRLAHIGKGSSSSSRTTSRAQTPAALGENALDKANNLEMQQAPVATLLAKGKLDGELVDRDDLWSCLFGKPRGIGGGVSGELQREVDRHLRADAAEERREAGDAAEG